MGLAFRPHIAPYFSASATMTNEHDRASRAEMIRRIALLGQGSVVDEGAWRALHPADRDGLNLLLVPDAVLDRAEADAIGVTRESHIYGGVTPHGFVSTKIISHGLLLADAPAPAGWSHALGKAIAPCVLDGFSVFSVADAKAAGRLLLASGPARVKDVDGTSGRGQTEVASIEALDAAIEERDPEEIAAKGLVIEENLEDVTTFSVGMVTLFGRSIAYWGTQRLTMNNHGETVYGGSQLHVVRGGFDALAREAVAPELAEAVAKATAYDRAVFEAYPGLIASRRNYDVAFGHNGRGERRIGVLEQSWRPGGASGAEIAAFEALARDPDRHCVTCATMEVYGEVDAAPPQATLYYGGVDSVAGPMTKYVVEL
jgi:hypothetical protein